MALIKTKFILGGALAGATIVLGSRPFPFVNGEVEFVGSESETKAIAHALAINWQAFPEGHPRLKELSDGVSEVQPNQDGLQGNSLSQGDGTVQEAPADGSATADTQAGEAQSVPDGHGHPDGVNEKLRRAVMSLDPQNDAHWTAAGEPAMKAVEAAYGSTGITRDDIKAAAPGYNRKAAVV
jgi:hypothetical protein